MKRLSLPLLFVAAMASVLVACKKEPIQTANPSFGAAKSGEKPSAKDCYEGVKMECGMLAFQNDTHFQEIYDCLKLRMKHRTMGSRRCMVIFLKMITTTWPTTWGSWMNSR